MPPQPILAGPRKGMRRGTHSCYECRKRKTRCLFAKDSKICESCAARGKRCIEQRRELLQAAALDSRESLRDRVARLEGIIQATSGDSDSVGVDHLGINQQSIQAEANRPKSSLSPAFSNPTTQLVPTTNASISIEKDSPQSIDPLVSLFDNAIWKRDRSDWAEERISKIDDAGKPGAENPHAETKQYHTHKSLLSDVLPRELLEMVMNATCSWWHTWRPVGPWLSTSIGDRNILTLPDFVFWAFDSPNPSIVGLALLCVAVCLQQLDTRVHQYIIRQLPRLPGVLFQEYIQKVDRFIINDLDYASTEQGIETIMLSAKIYMNLGRQRKCWVLTHQAIAYSQLLGFHRPERLSADETDEERNRRNQSWLWLCSVDVYSSLLLGLPYAADGRTIPVSRSQHNATSFIKHNLILISASIVDRNQRGSSLSVSCTEEIQKALDTLTKPLDGDFWNSPAALASGRITRQEYLEQIAVQCWLYQLLVLLHMPLMIHSVDDAQLEKHRIACLEASRNFLKIYQVMRSDTVCAFNMVKVIDYQAFVCSGLLILGLLGYGNSKHHTANQDKDRDMINLAIATLRQASGTVNNPIASQAVQGLETLMWMDGNGCSHKKRDGCTNPYAKVVVPNIGTIKISPGEFYNNPSSESVSSPGNQPALAFTLSHSMFEEIPSMTSQPPTLASDIAFDGGQVTGLESSDKMDSEFASIDFNWASTVTPNFEDDWAWLNDLSY